MIIELTKINLKKFLLKKISFDLKSIIKGIIRRIVDMILFIGKKKFMKSPKKQIIIIEFINNLEKKQKLLSSLFVKNIPNGINKYRIKKE